MDLLQTNRQPQSQLETWRSSGDCLNMAGGQHKKTTIYSWRYALLGAACFGIAGCASTPDKQSSVQASEQSSRGQETILDNRAKDQQTTDKDNEQGRQEASIKTLFSYKDERGVLWQQALFSNLPGWEQSGRSENLTAAFNSYLGSCHRFSQTAAPDESYLLPCAKARQLADSPAGVPQSLIRKFFESSFTPFSISTDSNTNGLLTAYYEPELPVRAKPEGAYNEPILARPEDLITVKLKKHDASLPNKRLVGRVEQGELIPYYPRSEIRKKPGRVLAWGKAIDVFFLQVQGSGRIRFDDGKVARAAFAGHNGLKYRSIGKALIKRGDLAANKASKQGIENWMHKAGAQQTQKLMNENPRYVFFQKQKLQDPSQGPKGTQGVPLTKGASIAIDPAFHPFGSPVWLQTKLPAHDRDWRGKEHSFMAITQDSGGAIKGPMRADLFMGSGDAAGKLAGIQKHAASWWVMLPNGLVQKRKQNS